MEKQQHKQLLILVFGHNSAGKSTLSKEIESKININRVNGDTMRDLLIKNIKYYSDTNYSYPNEKIKSANRPVSIFRKELIKELLLQGQSVLVDGAGITGLGRKTYLNLKKYSEEEVTTIVIEVVVNEKILLERLKKRDTKNTNFKWINFYKDIRIQKYRAVKENEADYVLRYDQKNLKQIIKIIQNIQNNKYQFPRKR